MVLKTMYHSAVAIEYHPLLKRKELFYGTRFCDHDRQLLRSARPDGGADGRAGSAAFFFDGREE